MMMNVGRGGSLTISGGSTARPITQPQCSGEGPEQLATLAGFQRREPSERRHCCVPIDELPRRVGAVRQQCEENLLAVVECRALEACHEGLGFGAGERPFHAHLYIDTRRARMGACRLVRPDPAGTCKGMTCELVGAPARDLTVEKLPLSGRTAEGER